MHADRLDFSQRLSAEAHHANGEGAREAGAVHRVDVNTLENGPAARLEMNDIAAVDIRTALPLYFDPYPHESRDGKLSF